MEYHHGVFVAIVVVLGDVVVVNIRRDVKCKCLVKIRLSWEGFCDTVFDRIW